MARALASTCASVSRSSAVQSSSYEGIAHVSSLGVGGGGADLYSESFVEGKQREGVGDPRLGMALIAGVHAIYFTAVLHGHTVNPGEFDAD